MRSYAFSLLAVAVTASAATINSQQQKNFILETAKAMKSGLVTLGTAVETITKPSDTQAFHQALESMTESIEGVMAQASEKMPKFSAEEYQTANLPDLVPIAETTMVKALDKYEVMAQDPKLLEVVNNDMRTLLIEMANLVVFIEERLPDEKTVSQLLGTWDSIGAAMCMWKGVLDDSMWGEGSGEGEGNGEEEGGKPLLSHVK